MTAHTATRPLFEMMLMGLASKYDLTSRSDRARSALDLSTLFCEIQRIVRPAVTFEIGACYAEFSIKMAELGFRAVAFEANPHNYTQISNMRHVKESGAQYLFSAVGRSTGTTQFFLQKKINGKDIDIAQVRGNNSLLPRKFGSPEYVTVDVPIVTLSDFVKDSDLTGKPYSVWIDVEGAADDVLAGAESTLDDCQSVMIEVEQSPCWEGQILSPQVMDFFLDRDFIPVARDFQYKRQFNLVFVRRAVFDNPFVKDLLVNNAAGTARA